MAQTSATSGVFANGFQGDIRSLDYILKTLERKTYIVPGKSVNPDLSVSVAGEIAYYMKRAASTVAEGTTGAKIDFESTGVSRQEIPMRNAFHIKSVIPYANSETVSVDVVGDRVVQETMELANRYNVKFLEALKEGSMTAESATGETIYHQLLNAKAQYKKANKDKAMGPTAIFLTPEKVAELKSKNLLAYKEALPGEGNDTLIGTFDGMAVFEAVDLDGVDCIMLNAVAFAAPINVNVLRVVDGTAAGYVGGTLIGGEFSYGFDVCDAKDYIKGGDDAKSQGLIRSYTLG